MKRTGWPVFLVLLSTSVLAKDLDLVSSYERSEDPLTTEKIWKLDPQELNPHRQRWIVQRLVRIKGLESRKIGDQYGVSADALESSAKGFVRPAGPWYRPITEFPCDETPSLRIQDAFATEEGARKALDTAANLWRDLLKKDLVGLSLRLEKVRAPSSDAALRKGLVLFEEWLKLVESDWEAAKLEARKVEWASYVERARAESACSGKRKPSAEPVWEKLMEPPAESPVAKPLVRAPARRWNGLYSVRLSVEISGQNLSGQFLIDSSAPKSVLSPAWLESQGVREELVTISGAEPERATWSVASKGGVATALAPRASVDRVRLSGYELELKEFLLQDVDFFGPPETAGSCCDGILGWDFLRKHVVEFDGSGAAGIRLWPKNAFRPPARAKEDSFWAEVQLTRAGPRSSCRIQSESDPFGASGAPRFEGVIWNSGNSESMLTREASLSKLIAANPSIRWSVECGQHLVARDTKIEVPPTPPAGASRAADIAAGMPLLTRDWFIFDLPHGRVWFSKDAMSLAIPQNRSGLVLKYKMEKGDRALVVQKIDEGTPAQALAQAGLKVGARIEELDGKPSEDLDQWEVDQRLSGRYGDQVTLKWGGKRAAKIAPLILKSASKGKSK